MAGRLLRERTGLRGLASTDLATLAEIHGVGPAKATTIAAAFELGRRAALEDGAARPQVTGPADIARLLHPEMEVLPQEELRLLVLDTKHRVLAAPMLYRGTVNAAPGRVAEVFREAVRRGAPKITLAHNHPSGDPTPSRDDIEFTRAIIEAGQLLDVEVLDHLVFGHGAGAVRLHAGAPAGVRVGRKPTEPPRARARSHDMRSLAAAAGLAAVMIAATLAPPDVLHACTFGLFDGPADRLEQQVRTADAIVVGAVVEERVTRDPRFAERTPYTSSLRVERVLKGDALSSVEVEWLGHVQWDLGCIGGPRLREGEQVLLFLQRGHPATGTLGLPPDMWSVVLQGQGAYLIEAGTAYYTGPYGDDREPAGDAAALLDEVERLALLSPGRSAGEERPSVLLIAGAVVLLGGALLVERLARARRVA